MDHFVIEGNFLWCVVSYINTLLQFSFRQDWPDNSTKDKALDGLEGALTLTMKSKGQEIKNTTFCLRSWKRLRSLLNHSMQNSYYRRQKNGQKIQNEDIFA